MQTGALVAIYRLGIKELWSLWRDPMMLLLIVYVFSVGVYTAATAMPETLQRPRSRSSMRMTRPGIGEYNAPIRERI